MTDKKKIIILTSKGGQGLISGSWAIKEGLESLYGDQVKVTIIDFFEEGRSIGKNLTGLYNLLLRKSLRLSALYIKMLHVLRTDKWSFLYRKLQKPFRELMEHEKPDAIILTSQYIVSFVSDYKNKFGINSKTFVGNLDSGTSCIPLWFGNHIDKHIIPTDECKIAFDRLELKESQALMAKLTVRQKFKDAILMPRNQLRGTLGLEQDEFYTLFTGSREGYEGIIPMIEDLCLNTISSVVVICGKNDCLKSKIENLKMSKNLTQIYTVGWTENVQDYMRACDVVVAKPGKQTMKECIATHSPMISITFPAVMEQELGNLEFMENREILIKATSSADITDLVQFFLTNSEELELHRKRVEKASEGIDSRYVAKRIWEEI